MKSQGKTLYLYLFYQTSDKKEEKYDFFSYFIRNISHCLRCISQLLYPVSLFSTCLTSTATISLSNVTFSLYNSPGFPEWSLDFRSFSRIFFF